MYSLDCSCHLLARSLISLWKPPVSFVSGNSHRLVAYAQSVSSDAAILLCLIEFFRIMPLRALKFADPLLYSMHVTSSFS
jgi:hypothetical protein